MTPSETQYDILKQLLKRFVRDRPSENHSVHYDVFGQIETQVWPRRVPTAIYIRMKENAELDHPSTR